MSFKVVDENSEISENIPFFGELFRKSFHKSEEKFFRGLVRVSGVEFLVREYPSFHECGNDSGKVGVVDNEIVFVHPYWSIFFQKLDDDPLIDGNHGIDAVESGFFHEKSDFFGRIAEIGVVVRIADSEISAVSLESAWRRFFVGIEFPVVIVDIAFFELLHLPFVEFKRENASRESAVGSKLVLILVENHIPFRFRIAEESENRIEMSKGKGKDFLDSEKRLEILFEFFIEKRISERLDPRIVGESDSEVRIDLFQIVSVFFQKIGNPDMTPVPGKGS